MPATPKKLNLSFARNAYNVFGKRDSAARTEQQTEQKTELLQGKKASFFEGLTCSIFLDVSNRHFLCFAEILRNLNCALRGDIRFNLIFFRCLLDFFHLVKCSISLESC